MWSTIEIFSGYSFTTVRGLRFRYAVNGNEIQINRKKKSVTRSSVKIALKVTLEKNGKMKWTEKIRSIRCQLFVSYVFEIWIDTERKLNGHLPDMDNI